MSRGPGTIQRKVVAKLAIYPYLDVKNLTQLIFFQSYRQERQKSVLTRAQINSIHRAVKLLAKRGIVKPAKKISDEGAPCWMMARPVMDLERVKRAARKSRGKKPKLSVIPRTGD